MYYANMSLNNVDMSHIDTMSKSCIIVHIQHTFLSKSRRLSVIYNSSAASRKHTFQVPIDINKISIAIILKVNE